jgi:hypothetical protein
VTLDINEMLLFLLILMGGSLVLALLLIGLVVWRLRKIKLPPDADIFTALRATPFVVVLVLDLLDFSLDFLSAPFSWALLSRLGLKPLRGVTVVESLIPGTQFLPTMTTAWVLARLLRGQKWVDRLS